MAIISEAMVLCRALRNSYEFIFVNLVSRTYSVSSFKYIIELYCRSLLYSLKNMCKCRRRSGVYITLSHFK